MFNVSVFSSLKENSMILAVKFTDKLTELSRLALLKPTIVTIN